MKHTLHNTMTKAEYIFGICYLVAQQFLIPWLLVLGAVWLKLPPSDLWLNFAFFALNFLVVCVAFSRYLGKNLRTLGKNILPVLGYGAAGFLLYWSANVLVSLFIAIYFPGFANANDVNIQTMASEQYPIMFIGSVLLVPLVEETLYRGVVFGFIYRYSRVAAYAATTLLFAFVHVVGYMGSLSPAYLLVSILQYVPAGLCLSWAYARTNTIFTPILIHTAVNLIGMLAMR